MTREQNREAFPKFAGVIDQLRGLYGSDLRVRYVEEGGRSLGKMLEPDEVEIDGATYVHAAKADTAAQALNRANPRRSEVRARK